MFLLSLLSLSTIFNVSFDYFRWHFLHDHTSPDAKRQRRQFIVDPQWKNDDAAYRIGNGASGKVRYSVRACVSAKPWPQLAINFANESIMRSHFHTDIQWTVALMRPCNLCDTCLLRDQKETTFLFLQVICTSHSFDCCQNYFRLCRFSVLFQCRKMSEIKSSSKTKENSEEETKKCRANAFDCKKLSNTIECEKCASKNKWCASERRAKMKRRTKRANEKEKQ